ncbi:MAG: DUF1667 domain-containing protein [Clostridia bacterium]|nr:DUF1667 domain-containing protein [Clostridia bacterium]
MKRTLTCIVCPLGCTLEVELDKGNVISVSGNTCVRGKEYAVTECISPMRTVTSTVKCDDGRLVAVKTSRPIPKEKMFDCVKIINNSLAHLPIGIGDVIIKDVYGSDIVATQERN